MNTSEAKRKVEELTGRYDAVNGEITKAKREIEKFKGLNQPVEAREAEDDLGRLQSRLKQIEVELNQLRKFWK